MKQVRGTDALLVWARNSTAGYNNVNVESWDSPSWRNGLAFCAIIHHFAPNLIGEFGSLSKENVRENNEKAFIAAEKLDVASLLDAEDMAAMQKPDRKSIQLYVSSLYKAFKDYKAPASSSSSQTQKSPVCQLDAAPSGSSVSSQPVRSALAAMVLADDESKKRDRKSAVNLPCQTGTLSRSSERQPDVDMVRSQPGRTPLATAASASNSQNKDQQDQVVKTDLLRSLAQVRGRPRNSNNYDSNDGPQNTNKKQMDVNMSASKVSSQTEKAPAVTTGSTREDGNSKSKDQQDLLVKTGLQKSSAEVKDGSQSRNSSDMSDSLYSPDTGNESEVKFSPKDVTFNRFPERHVDIGMSASRVRSQTEKAPSATMASTREDGNSKDQVDKMVKAGLHKSSAKVKDRPPGTNTFDSSASSLSQNTDYKSAVESASLPKHTAGGTNIQGSTDKSASTQGSTGEKKIGSYSDWQLEAEKKLASLLETDFDEFEDKSDNNSIRPVEEKFVTSDVDIPSIDAANKDNGSQAGLDLDVKGTLEENNSLSPEKCENRLPLKHKKESSIKSPNSVHVLPKNRLLPDSQPDIEIKEEMTVDNMNNDLIDTPSSDPTISPNQTRKVSLDVTFNYNSNNSGERALKTAEVAATAGHFPPASSPPKVSSKCPSRISATELHQQLLEIDSKLSELESRERNLEDSVRNEGREETEVRTAWFPWLPKILTEICGEKIPGTRA